MNAKDFETKEKNTWCPGCPNFIMLEAFKEAISQLVNEKKLEAKKILEKRKQLESKIKKLMEESSKSQSVLPIFLSFRYLSLTKDFSILKIGS